MKLILLSSILLANSFLFAQNLNWNTISYTTGALSTNFGSVGSPSSTTSLNITGSTAQITSGFPVKYIANPPGTGNDCSVNCALRSSISFTTLAQSVVYTFSFSPAVTGLSFNIYDVDGNNTNGDRGVVSATGPFGAQNIFMTSLDAGGPTVTGSGTPSATATGTQGNTTDQRVGVSIIGGVSTLIITYSNNPSGSAGNRSFSIGNMAWSGTLPVKITSFSGQKISTGEIVLKWKANNENNVSKYEIERSIDGLTFETAGSLTALNSSGNYSFTDIRSQARTLFYRIKQIDNDGRFQYSSVIALRFTDAEKTGVTIFPNPVTNSVFITTKNNNTIETIRIFDSNGKMVMQKNGTENNIYVGNLSSGLYKVMIIDKNGDLSFSTFIKK